MTTYSSFCLCLLALLTTCGQKPTVNRVDPPRSDGRLSVEGISKEAAITIANEDALKDYKSLAAFKVVPCEQSIFWRIIYDGGGPEYVIDKSSGRVIRKQMLPQGSTENKRADDLRDEGRRISQQAAINTALRDARETYGDKIDLDQCAIVACELSNVWRVVFDYKLEPGEGMQNLPNGSFPKYVIDKRTGKILHKAMN